MSWPLTHALGTFDPQWKTPNIYFLKESKMIFYILKNLMVKKTVRLWAPCKTLQITLKCCSRKHFEEDIILHVYSKGTWYFEILRKLYHVKMYIVVSIHKSFSN